MNIRSAMSRIDSYAVRAGTLLIQSRDCLGSQHHLSCWSPLRFWSAFLLGDYKIPEMASGSRLVFRGALFLLWGLHLIRFCLSLVVWFCVIQRATQW